MDSSTPSKETFIDVRTNEEWDAGHAPGAVHFELARLEAGELPDISKDASVALYCARGVRAGKALEILKSNGFTHLRNAGGLSDVLNSLK